ncbi:MAG: class I SAM-dependent methyltransferase [Bacteriovoracaceae bacterium]
MSKSWSKYYEITSNRNVHPILQLGLDFIKTPGTAYDMGAGSGVDTGHLLKLGWNVHAVDNEESSIKFMEERLTDYESLVLEKKSFEKLKMKPCNLIFGSASFPFCPPDHFIIFWNKMRSVLMINGIVCGNFFGYKDDWSSRKDMTFQNEKSIIQLFRGYEILFFDELEEDKETALGTMKHWHIYSFVLRKV